MAGAHESVKNSVELVEFCLLPKVETIGTWASDQDDGAVEESVLVLVLWKDLAGGTWGIPCGKNESQWRQCHALGNVELGNLGVLPVVCVLRHALPYQLQWHSLMAVASSIRIMLPSSHLFGNGCWTKQWSSGGSVGSSGDEKVGQSQTSPYNMLKCPRARHWE